MTEEEYNKQAQAAVSDAAKRGVIVDPVPYNASMYKTVATPRAAAALSSTSDDSPSNVAEIYEVLAPMAGNYANAQAEQIGQAQRSMGPMAAAVQGTTTSGLGNYTYNRLMRPQIDAMRDTILTQGYANQLNRLLSDALNSARNNYNKSTGNNGNNKNSNAWSGDFEHQTKDESKPAGSEYDPSSFVKDKYKFDNYGNMMGYTGKYPLTVSGPNGSTSYQDYTSDVTDPQAKATKWYKYLKSIGYAG